MTLLVILEMYYEQSFFKGKTFSKHSKSEVKNTLIENTSDGKIESSSHWTAELICAGHLSDLWELIFFYMSKSIHLGNPKIVFYLEIDTNYSKE
jgi:hypothetical protein